MRSVTSTDSNEGDSLAVGQSYELTISDGFEVKGLQATVLTIEVDDLDYNSGIIVFNSFAFEGYFDFITARKL